MSHKENQELELITNPTVRERHLSRVEVLDRVGGLLLLPNTELATTNQVADFYRVDREVLKKVIQRNREELESNGMKIMSFTEIRAEIKIGTNGDTMSPLEIKPKVLGLSPKGSGIFTKRAILNVGFLLTESDVAKEVRNQALNIIENTSDEVKVKEIVDEKELLMAIMFASNEVERAKAISEHLEYTNRFKRELEETIQKQVEVIEQKEEVIAEKDKKISELDELIKALTDGVPVATQRQGLNELIRKGCRSGQQISDRWSILYNDFNLAHHMNVKIRCKNFNLVNGTNLKIIEFIERELGMLTELYTIAIRIFKYEAEQIKQKREELLVLV